MEGSRTGAGPGGRSVAGVHSQVTAARGRRHQGPFTRRLLDLPWEDVLLPHVLSRVPLCQLLRLQRVSRAFRALVQLHLAGLRRFDAAQVSWGPEPRPRLGTAPARLQPSSQPVYSSGPLWVTRNARKAIHPAESTLRGRVLGVN